MSGKSASKRTGWKFPLLFCAGICLVVAVVALWRHWTRPDVPPLDPALLARAEVMRIDLAADAEGRALKELITDSATGFGSHEQKDARLAALARESAGQGRFDAACTAAVLIYNDYKRDGLLADLARHAAADCATLPWGVFAVKGMREPGVQIDAVLLLNARHRQCAEQPGGRSATNPAAQDASPGR